MDEIVNSIHDPGKLEEAEDRYLRLTREQRKGLILALKAERNESAGRFLVAILPGEGDKEIHKLIRKLIFRLKTMGVMVEEPPAAGEPVLKKVEEAREHRGFMSNYDADGSRIVIAAFEVKKHNFIFVKAMTHLSDGLTDLELAPMTRQDFNTIIADYVSKTTARIAFVEISPRYAAYLIEEGDSRYHHFREDVKHLTQFASSLKSEVEKPEDIYNLAIPDGVEPLPEAEILTSSVFALFNLEWDTADKDKEAFAALGASTILVPPHILEDKKKTFVKTLLETRPLKSMLLFMKRTLEDYAYIFFRTEQFDSFKGLIELLRSDEGPYRALFFFVWRTLEAGEKAPEQPGVIVNPYEQIRR